MDGGITAELADFCASVDAATLPPEVVARVRLLVTDLTGCIVRAQSEAPSASALYAAAKALGLSEGRHRTFGDVRTQGPAGAVFLNIHCPMKNSQPTQWIPEQVRDD